jgi:hypothetical protein
MSAVEPAPGRAILPVGKIGAAVAAFETAKRVRNEAQNYWREHYAWTVSVSEADQLYADVHAWLLSIMPTEKQRTLLVSSRKNGSRRMYAEDDDMTTPGGGKADSLKIRFDDSADRTVDIRGHKVKVWLDTPDPGSSPGFGMREPKKIKFQAATHAGQQAVVAELDRIHTEKAGVRKPTLKMVSSWGDWTTRSDLPARTLESVALPPSQKTRIVNDLERFIEAEERYNRLAIPWHRGYMFHGPPGTGKTSLVKALANHFELDLWYVGLADLRPESGLMQLISNVGSRSILLLEDIDTIKITNDESTQESGAITIGSLLNALDGVATPHGLITMMTTNNFDRLDPRLIRAGRMDFVEELGYPTWGTVRQMFEMFYEGYTAWSDEAYFHEEPLLGVSPAQFAEIFKNNLDDPWAARDQANELIARHC